MRLRERYDTLYAVRDLVQQGNWITFDCETCSLEGEIVSWAVAAPDGTILGQGFIRPTGAITEGSRAVHGIQDEQVAAAPTFAEVWPMIWKLLMGKNVVAYNASFDEARLFTSAWPHFCFLRGEPKLRWFCAMEAFAAVYGAWHDYFHSYTWQTLETACHFFRISHDQAHSAAGDASATALVMQALAAMAEEELPEGYHLPIDVPCSGGRGQTETHRSGDAGAGRWYCGPCGVQAGVFHRCPCCQQKWAIVYTANAEELCETCYEARALERGEYHHCPGCGGIVKAPERQQKYHSQRCQRRAARQRREQREAALPDGATPVQEGRHQLEAIREGNARWRYTVCRQTWTNGGVRSVCPGVPTYASWASVPANFVTWTELRQRHHTTSRTVPHGAVRVLHAPYYRYLYDLQRSTPVPISPERQAAIEKAKATTQARFTCRLCQTYSPSPAERKAFRDQVCEC